MRINMEPGPAAADIKLPKWYVAVLPLILVLAVNYYLSRVYTWDPAILAPLSGMKLPLMAPAVKNVIGIWALVIGLVEICPGLLFQDLV